MVGGKERTFHLFCSTNARVSKCVVGEAGCHVAVYWLAACCSPPVITAAAGPAGITPTGSTRAPLPPPLLGCICGCGDAGCDPGGGADGDPMGVPADLS